MEENWSAAVEAAMPCFLMQVITGVGRCLKGS